ncbi:hypothetical protein [Roseibium litorale]|uniref:Uncharacterized protein n=1 Tax=Roseibium litorale TaxID=2803841 RepID=A0ABR9CQ19_9HYPH|nr:hypothetical protein [Roseibium litorale]MBD8892956.1 hypothetical protein [Roseibium litorale]
MTAGIIRWFRLAGSLLTVCAVLPAAALAEPATLTAPAPSAELAGSYDQLETAWTASPLAFTAAGFAEGPARGYGKYTPRESAVFAPGETMTVYVQPVGYGFNKTGSGYDYAMDASYRLITPSGQVLAAENKFAALAGSSRAEDRQAFTSLNFTFEGLPEGSYTLETTFADAIGGKTGVISLSFEVKAAK